jgi:hypothetical protein
MKTICFIIHQAKSLLRLLYPALGLLWPLQAALASDCPGTNQVIACNEANLRAAISQGGIVNFCCDGVITLASTINITNDVTLDATDRAVTISGNQAVRLFNVSTGINFTVSNITLANGWHVGADGENAQSGEPGQGGAIFSFEGNVHLISCVLSNNLARGGRGGSDDPIQLLPYGSGGHGQGGAIFSTGGMLVLQHVHAISNSAAGGPPFNGESIGQVGQGGEGSGGVIYSAGATVSLEDSIFENNRCQTPDGHPGMGARGGVLYLVAGEASIGFSTFQYNEAVGDSHPYIAGHVSVPSSGYGGAIFADESNLAIHRAKFISNRARGGNGFRHSGTGEGEGGAIHSTSSGLILESTFSENQALAGNLSSLNRDGRGGALLSAGSMRIVGSTFERNLARGGNAGSFGSIAPEYPGGHAYGGAIFNSGTLLVTNSTFTLSSAIGGDGAALEGLSGSAFGGGLYHTNGTVILVNSTLASNMVDRLVWETPFPKELNPVGGSNLASTNGTATLRNTILAYGGTNGNSWGTITDGGFNMSSDGSANFSGGASFNFTDPKLGPLADNGGPTLTMALLPESPAIDFGGSAGSPSTDQRGFSRPYGAGVDIGAFEWHPGLPEIRLQQTSVSSLELSFSAAAGTSWILQFSSDLAAWNDIETIGANQNSATVTRTINNAGETTRFFRLLQQ